MSGVWPVDDGDMAIPTEKWGLDMLWARLAVAIVVLNSGLALATSYGLPLENRIWDLREGAEIDRSVLVQRLLSEDVVLLGEVHDNADAHQAQGALVRLLQPSALAVEMIQAKDEAALKGFLSAGGAPDQIGPHVGWNESGWPAWAIYAPVFRYFKPGVVTGAALPRAAVRRSMTEGAAAIALDPPMHAKLAEPLPASVQEGMQAEMVTAHCGHLPKEMAPGMIQAQRLRDASQASAVLRARAATDGMVALIAGNGHVRMDRGAGTYLPDGLNVAAVGILEADIGIAPEEIVAAGLPYDFVWFVAPAEREDPCAVFLKKK